MTCCCKNSQRPMEIPSFARLDLRSIIYCVLETVIPTKGRTMANTLTLLFHRTLNLEP